MGDELFNTDRQTDRHKEIDIRSQQLLCKMDLKSENWFWFTYKFTPLHRQNTLMCCDTYLMTFSPFIN